MACDYSRLTDVGYTTVFFISVVVCLNLSTIADDPRSFFYSPWTGYLTILNVSILIHGVFFESVDLDN